MTDLPYPSLDPPEDWYCDEDCENCRDYLCTERDVNNDEEGGEDE